MTFDLSVADSIVATIESRANAVAASLANGPEVALLRSQVSGLQSQLDTVTAERDIALAENAAAEQKIAEWSNRLQVVATKIEPPAAG